MAAHQHLPQAPITEALVAVDVSPREGLDFLGLKNAIESRLPDDYYVKGPISEGTVELTIAPGETAQAAHQRAETGLRLHSTDDKYGRRADNQALLIA